MRLVVTTEARYAATLDGRVWTATVPAYSFWAQYRPGFDLVRVVARVQPVAQAPAGLVRVDGDGVEVYPVPYYLGAQQYLRRRSAVARAVRAAATAGDAVVLRVPSQLGTLLADAREEAGLPYALEVVGDPYHVFAPGVVGHPLRPFLRAASVRALARHCRHAAAVAYVTERALQERYPASESACTASFSTVQLGPEAFVAAPRPAERRLSRPPRLVCVGSLAQLYKGTDTLVTAVAQLCAEDRPVELVQVGDGRFRPQLERLARRLGVADQVTFVGSLAPGEPVRAQLDAADVFVLASRTEGLPRALIEAMARGLPAIASAVGGIPELLPAPMLVPPDDPAAMAAAVVALLTSPRRLAEASAHNLHRARTFSAEAVMPVRRAWYEAVRTITRSYQRAAVAEKVS